MLFFAYYLSRSPNIRLSLGDRLLFLAMDALVYIRHPLLVRQFLLWQGYWPRPCFPRRFHEKMLWRKLFDHDPRFTLFSDKLAAKQHIKQQYPELRVANTLWQGTDPADIPDAVLSGDCVVKANHGSGMNIVVRGGECDRAELVGKSTRWLASAYGKRHYEWGYRGIEPKVYVENLLLDNGLPVESEFKFHVSGGEVYYAFLNFTDPYGEVQYVILDRQGQSRVVLADVEPDRISVPFDRPANWSALVEAARSLGNPFDHVRCDLYVVGGEVYFSEMTFYSFGGYDWVGDRSIMEALNENWDIRRSWFLTESQSGWRGYYARRLKRALESSSTV